MPSFCAAASPFARSREASAVTAVNRPRCMAGTTFWTAMFAAPRTPKRRMLAILFLQAAHQQAHGLGDADGLADLGQRAGAVVDAEHDDVVRVAVRGQQEGPGRVDREVARVLP